MKYILALFLVVILVLFCTKEKKISRTESYVFESSIQGLKEFEHIMIRDPQKLAVPSLSPKKAILETQALKQELFNSNHTELNWEERGPSNVGGRTRAFIFDKKDRTNNIAFAGGITGGLWKCTNLMDIDNHQWIPIGDFWSNIKVSAIVQDPNNLDHFYVGTGESWDPEAPGMGIWKSIDNGISWYHLPSTTDSTFHYVNRLLFDVNGHLYACTADGGVQKTKDFGVTWTKVLGFGMSSTTDFSSDIEIGADGNLYASIGGWNIEDSVYRSDYSIHQNNTGDPDTWETIPLPNNHRRIELACSETDNQIIYAIGAGVSRVEGIYRSEDQGTNWTSLPLPTNNPNFLLAQANYNLTIEVDPKRDSTVIIGAVGFFKSLNAGQSWSYSLLGHADQHHFVFLPTNEDISDTVIVCNDGGIYLGTEINTHQFISSYRSLNNNYNVTQFYGGATHPSAGSPWLIGGTQDNGGIILKQPGFGPGINYFSGGSSNFQGDNGFSFIDETDPQLQFIARQNNEIYYTRDGWDSRDFVDGGKGSRVNRMDYDQVARKLYSYFDSNHYLRWNDPASGETLDTVELIDDPGFITAMRVSPNVPHRLYLASISGSIYRIEDAHIGMSKSATVIRSDEPNLFCSSIEIEEGNEDHIIITFSNFGVSSVWETNNATDPNPIWTDIEGNLPDMPIRWSLLAPGLSDTCLLATETGVWISTDLDGINTTWLPCTDFPTVRTDMLKHRKSDKQILAVTYGRGLFTSDYFNGYCPEVLHITEHPLINTSYYASDTITSVSKIQGNLSIGYYSGNVVELRPLFEVGLGNIFEVSIANCNN